MLQHLRHPPAERGQDAEVSIRRRHQQNHSSMKSRDLLGRRLHLLLRLAMLERPVVRVERVDLCRRQRVHQAIVHRVQNLADLDPPANRRSSTHRCSAADLPLSLSRRRRGSLGRGRRQHALHGVHQIEQRPGHGLLENGGGPENRWLSTVRHLHVLHSVCALRLCQLGQ